MKAILLRPITALAVVSLSLVSLRANDDGPGDQNQSEGENDDCQRGGDVDGTELLEQEVRLLPTADAPQGAGGKAELEAENEDGVTSATLEVETEGLLEGTYTVSTRSITDGTATVLGTITVTVNDSGEDCDEDNQGEDGDMGDNDNDDDGVVEITRHGSEDGDDEDDDGDNHNHGENRTSGDGEFGNETKFAFPEGFNPLDIAAVEISDANGVVVLKGDFTNLGTARRSNLQFEVRIAPGHAAPTAAGAASLQVRASRHVVRQKFHLKASNVPANSALTVKINGQPVGRVRTTRHGNVSMRRLPRGTAPHRIYSVSFDTATGVRVLSAQF